MCNKNQELLDSWSVIMVAEPLRNSNRCSKLKLEEHLLNKAPEKVHLEKLKQPDKLITDTQAKIIKILKASIVILLRTKFCTREVDSRRHHYHKRDKLEKALIY